MSRTLVLGTRGSALALAQVELVRAALRRSDASLKIEVKKITTSGDRKIDVTAVKQSTAGVKGLFTKEIQQALLSGEIDAGVHSLKDLPGALPPGLKVAAVLERANTSDVLIAKSAKSFSDLPPAARIATSSVRRARQLRWMRPDLDVVGMRGNVPTRLKKLHESQELDGIVLARAGLDRLGCDITNFYCEELNTLPAVGQGAVALEIRADDEEVAGILAAINHEPTFLRIRAERELLRLLDGDCNLPVGVETKLGGGKLGMKAIIFGAEDEPPLTGEVEGNPGAPEDLAAALYHQIYG